MKNKRITKETLIKTSEDNLEDVMDKVGDNEDAVVTVIDDDIDESEINPRITKKDLLEHLNKRNEFKNK
jgi:hypothetical protein